MNFKGEIIRRYLQRLTMLAAAGAFAAGASLTMGGGAARAEQPNSDWNEIIAKFDNVSSNVLCFDEHDNFTVWLWHCHASDSQGALQRWQFQYLAGPSAAAGVPIYNIENLNSGLCLEYSGTTSGSAAVPGFCFKTQSQLEVTLAPGTNPLLGISVPGANLCLEPSNFSDTNGTRLQFNTCNPNDSQQILSFLP